MSTNSKTLVRNQSGFSLIELMVVVGIIALLAAIAIPQFTKFQNRAKQSEVQSSMSGVYTAEQAFSGQWGQYYGDFPTIGFTLGPAVIRYDCGFGGLGIVAPTGLPGAGTAAYDFDKGKVCSGGTAACTPTTDVATWSLVTANAVKPAAAAFELECSTQFNNGPAKTQDEWTIDQSQNVTNQNSGI